MNVKRMSLLKGTLGRHTPRAVAECWLHTGRASPGPTRRVSSSPLGGGSSAQRLCQLLAERSNFLISTATACGERLRVLQLLVRSLERLLKSRLGFTRLRQGRLQVGHLRVHRRCCDGRV